MPENLAEETCPFLDRCIQDPSIVHASVCTWARVTDRKGKQESAHTCTDSLLRGQATNMIGVGGRL